MVVKLQEEVEQKTFNIVVSTTKLTARTILNAGKAAIQQQQAKMAGGKQSVRMLLRQNRGVSSVEIDKTNIRGFERYAKKYGIDYVYANELEIIDGKLTGRYLGDVVDGKRKAELLRLIAQVEKVDIAQTIAVGDGANDLPMLGIAGLGIAFHAKPKVVANAKQSINTIGLDGVLYFLGFKDSYLNM